MGFISSGRGILVLEKPLQFLSSCLDIFALKFDTVLVFIAFRLNVETVVLTATTLTLSGTFHSRLDPSLLISKVRRKKTLQQCFEEFVHPEILTKDNQYRCDR